MERIICDTFVKGEKEIWDLNQDDPRNQEFNRKILAVNNMYGWLYEQGILAKTSFEMKNYSDAAFFALDVKDLAPYRESMAASGVEDADIAVHHIFDEPYTPCEYSGAIELGWTMRGYRDFDGTVGRSWECDLMKGLDSATVLEVADIKEQDGVRSAVRAAFDFSGFYASDITKTDRLMTVRPLTEADRKSVMALDTMSRNQLSGVLEDNTDYAWGLFLDKTLAGYCSIGYADEFADDGNGHGYPKCTSDSLLLSDVYVAADYRDMGCGSYLVDKAIRMRAENHKERVYLCVLDDSLCDFYKKIRFTSVADGVMMRDERAIDDIKREEAFEKAFSCYSSIDKSMLDMRNYLFSHADKLIECYERGEHLDLIDVDCWVRYENLLGECLNYDEYLELNAFVGDEDPHDITETDTKRIGDLRIVLQDFRDAPWVPYEPQTLAERIQFAAQKTFQSSKTASKPIDHLR